MSEQDKFTTEEEKDDVEGHKKKASDEPQAEGESEDFEAHKKK